MDDGRQVFFSEVEGWERAVLRNGLGERWGVVEVRRGILR